MVKTFFPEKMSELLEVQNTSLLGRFAHISYFDTNMFFLSTLKTKTKKVGGFSHKISRIFKNFIDLIKINRYTGLT